MTDLSVLIPTPFKQNPVKSLPPLRISNYWFNDKKTKHARSFKTKKRLQLHRYSLFYSLLISSSYKIYCRLGVYCSLLGASAAGSSGQDLPQRLAQPLHCALNFSLSSGLIFAIFASKRSFQCP